MPDALFEKSLGRAKRKFDLMHALGAPLMLVCSNTSRHSLERMRTLGILYDRDAAGGEYFHADSEPFAERFFFEIVQRSSYDAYGALNAPARMASQEQRDERTQEAP